jgi:hypothetical protein
MILGILWITMIKHEEGYLLPGKDKAEGNLR